jgi:CHAT domain-containing protein
MASLLSCRDYGSSPQLAFENANRAFIHGELQESKNEAKRRSEEFHRSDPQWACKFTVLEAKAALWQGLFDDAKSLLKSVPQPCQRDMSVSMLAIVAVANAHLHQFPAAEHALNEATKLCNVTADSACGEVLQARGLLASEQSNSPLAVQLFEEALSFAVAHQDSFLRSNALLNLSAEASSQGRFDEALDRAEAAVQSAKNADARILEIVARGNVGWAYYRLGDEEKALTLFLEAEKRAGEFTDFVDQGALLTYAGYVYMGLRQFSQAESSFQRALTIEKQLNHKEYVYDALRALGRLALLKGDLDKADQYADLALEIGRGNRAFEFYPMILKGQLAARRRDVARSRRILESVEQDKMCPVFLRWEAQHSLAQLYEAVGNVDAATRSYRAALSTFESARDAVRHEDEQLSFLTNAASIYDDFVHFMVTKGDVNEALRWADFDRARTLAEGLGLLPKKASLEPPSLHAQRIARRLKGTLLFYSLGETQSYLWAISPNRTALFTLPAGHEIDSAVRRFRQALVGPQDLLDSSSAEGRSLYELLVAPAEALFEKNGRVFVIPDGSLNNLSFETLVAPTPQPHYWIEDITVVNASSLRMLDGTYERASNAEPNLLLLGNSVAPNSKYPELPKAAMQVENVAAHFPASRRVVLTRQEATPTAYLNRNPGQFSHIHFVAHGTASRLSPLDSAIVLSNDGTRDDSFKLYARDIIQHPLRAELVTISACYGAEGRSYSGEGLVGLSWAFLKAGAHHVVAALWEATDASTVQLMETFYNELEKGASPESALRTAKLSLLHSNFHNPFYWAPFQLYVGSYRSNDSTVTRQRHPSSVSASTESE